MSEKLPAAIDLSHHLSVVGKARAMSPLKTMQRYWGKPGIISMAGGLPSPAYFPFESLSGDAHLPDSFPLTPPPKSSTLSWFWNLFAKRNPNTTPISVPKYSTTPDAVNLAAALQYQLAKGIPALQEIIHEFTGKVYKPGYLNFSTLVHIGNTDGFYRSVVTFCNPGEGVLVEEWTYPTALTAMRPAGVIPVAVAMDAEGMRSDSLQKMLSEWDIIARGMSRPHVLYAVPVGQNPTGATMGAIRKQEIYDICVEFDVIIIEDDPYYFLQEGPYLPKSQRLTQDAVPASGEEEYLSNLVPSFLKFDYQGRVIRLDTFSKTIAPGSRLGWFTCHPLFAERLERHGEISTQAPCGFGQSMVVKLLLTWKHEGYIRWLRALRVQYTLRRNQFLDCLGEEFHLQRASAVGGNREGTDVYFAFLKPNDTQIDNTLNERKTYCDKSIFSFVPPTSGMFVWIKLHLENCPSTPSDEESLEMRLWSMLADAGMLIVPGFMFQTEQSSNELEGHFRISFSDVEFDDMKRAIVIFEHVLRQFFTNP